MLICWAQCASKNIMQSTNKQSTLKREYNQCWFTCFGKLAYVHGRRIFLPFSLDYKYDVICNHRVEKEKENERVRVLLFVNAGELAKAYKILCSSSDCLIVCVWLLVFAATNIFFTCLWMFGYSPFALFCTCHEAIPVIFYPIRLMRDEISRLGHLFYSGSCGLFKLVVDAFFQHIGTGAPSSLI